MTTALRLLRGPYRHNCGQGICNGLVSSDWLMCGVLCSRGPAF